MARLPTPGSDNGVWGAVLNDYLGVEHNPDGTHKSSVNPDATTASKGRLRLSGDLGGTADTPTVPGLANKVDNSILTTKGDVYAASAAGTPARVAVGSNGQVLTADSGQTTGVKWASLAWINPLDFGAVGDGSTNDAAALQNAINAAISSKLPLFIPPKTFRLGASLTLSAPIVIYGAGWQSILQANDNLNDYIIKFNAGGPMTGAVLRDFAIDGNNSVQGATGGCIDALGAVQCHFVRLHLHHAAHNALFIHGDGLGGSGHHNRIVECLLDNSGGGAGDGRALRMEASDENWVANCDFESNGNSAASEPNHVFDLSGIQTFLSCSFVGGQTGIKVQADNTKIVSCTFDGVANHNIRLNGNQNLIEGNVFFTIGASASGNSVDGIWVDNVTRNSIVGNMFGGGSACRSGINIANGSTHTMATDNYFRPDTSFNTSPLILTGSNHVIRNNKGFATEAAGTATVSAVSTSIAVNHGLNVTPALHNILLTPVNDLGSSTKFWVSNPTSTQFTINVDTQPGGSGAAFGWSAVVL